MAKIYEFKQPPATPLEDQWNFDPVKIGMIMLSFQEPVLKIKKPNLKIVEPPMNEA